MKVQCLNLVRYLRRYLERWLNLDRAIVGIEKAFKPKMPFRWQELNCKHYDDSGFYLIK